MVSVAASKVLHRLAVLRGPFSARTARAVCAFSPVDAPRVAAALGELVSASLIEFDPGANRYRLLEPVRQYSMRRLDEDGDTEVAADRMADHIIGDLPDVAWDDASPDTPTHEDANIRAAIRRAIATGDAEMARRGCAGAIEMWRSAANLSVVLPLIEQALDLDDEATRGHATLLMRSIPVIALVRRWGAARPRIAALRRIADASGDPEVMGWAVLRTADDLAIGENDIDAAIEEYRRAIDLLREAGSEDVVRAFHQGAWTTLWAWDRWDEAETLADDWLTTCLSLGRHVEVAGAESYLAWLSAARGRTHGIEVHATTAQDIYRRFGDHRRAAITLGVLEYASLQRGDLDEALRRGQVALQASREMGAVPWVTNALIERAAILTAAGRSDEARACVAEAGSTILSFEDFGDTAVLAEVAARVVAADDAMLAAALVAASRSPARRRRIGLEAERIVLPALDAVVGDPTADLATRLGPDAHAKASSRFTSLNDRAIVAHIVHAMGVPPTAG
jgi:tetratricopeptide (TPR) repeat protein